MKLSDAILLGATMRPQTCNQWFEAAVWPNGATCALAAALDAIGWDIEKETEWEEASAAQFPISTESVRESPCGCSLAMIVPPRTHMDVQDVILHLNDIHSWTRQQIAAWVATIENSSAPQVHPLPAEQGAETLNLRPTLEVKC